MAGTYSAAPGFHLTVSKPQRVNPMLRLPDLPYAEDALQPVMSADTLRTHHGKHHQTYIDETNALAAEAGLADRALEEIVREARRRKNTKLFNNAAQAWNHAFYWNSMRPPGGAAPSGALAQAIQAFSGGETLAIAFVTAGTSQFGSGWVWLVAQGDALKILTTHDAEEPFERDDAVPLLVCDLWEHAYYLDHKNERKAFLARWIATLANWEFAAEQLAAASGEGAKYRFPAAVAI
jgi:superoxide dismutase, Fe-Mn family